MLEKILLMNQWQQVVMSGVILMITCLSMTLLSWIVQWAWAYMDDGEYTLDNWFAEKLAWTKYTYEDKNGWFYTNPELTGDYKGVMNYLITPVFDCYFIVLIGCFITPTILLICIHLYPIVLTVGSVVAFLKLGRFSRRLGKKVVKHIDDKEMHKQVDSSTCAFDK